MPLTARAYIEMCYPDPTAGGHTMHHVSHDGWTRHDGVDEHIPLLCPLSVGWQVRARGRLCGQ